MKKIVANILIIALLLAVFSGCGERPNIPGAISKLENTNEPQVTVTSTPTSEPTATNTITPEPTATNTMTPEPTATNTMTPEPTATNTPTPRPTATNTPTPRPTATNTPKPSPTLSPTPGIVEVKTLKTPYGIEKEVVGYKTQFICDGKILLPVDSFYRIVYDTEYGSQYNLVGVDMIYEEYCYITEEILKYDRVLLDDRAGVSDYAAQKNGDKFCVEDKSAYYITYDKPLIVGDHYLFNMEKVKYTIVTPTPTPQVPTPTPTKIPRLCDEDGKIKIADVEYNVYKYDEKIVQYLASHTVEENYAFMSQIGYNEVCYTYAPGESKLYRGYLSIRDSDKQFYDKHGEAFRYYDKRDQRYWGISESFHRIYSDAYIELSDDRASYKEVVPSSVPVEEFYAMINDMPMLYTVHRNGDHVWIEAGRIGGSNGG